MCVRVCVQFRDILKVYFTLVFVLPRMHLIKCTYIVYICGKNHNCFGSDLLLESGDSRSEIFTPPPLLPGC